MSERDRARQMLKEGYSIEDLVVVFGGKHTNARATRAWAYDLAQEIKNERRERQASAFRAFHMNGEG